MMTETELLLNGQPTTVLLPCTVAQALQAWGYDLNSNIVVAVNKVVVPRQDYAQHTLQADDRVEVLAPFAGG